ncbi:lipid II flippase Amj family protein [Spirosoma sp.]|uniref:lipid II flippase Amj family protein n=1 Tax=Spirosoma sp. TaxID=1899569 RepID=UPI00262DF3A5|nr:lipid II flippase Amj family protein [Spirosoma sp.]MCX6217432.1 lipid II flippase Amj family protein [Spirosoma sp.]
MTTQILWVLLLSFLINLISTLSYSVRIVGIRTRKIAVSVALFNVLVLVSRTANGFQAPLLANIVEKKIGLGHTDPIDQFYWILWITSLATVVGGLLIPSFQRLFSFAVIHFSQHKSISGLLLASVSSRGFNLVRSSTVIPNYQNITRLVSKGPFPWRVFVFNIIAVSVLTVGVLASLYAGYLNPDLRTTSSNLSSVINGLATILLFLFIDPYLSILTDEVAEGRYNEPDFRNQVVIMVIARLLGTLIAQLIFLPASQLIVFIAEHM